MFFNAQKIGRGFKLLAETWSMGKLTAESDNQKLLAIKRVLKEHPEIEEALLVAGADRIVAQVKTMTARSAPTKRETAFRAAKRAGPARVSERIVELRRIDEAKIEAFDKIVEMLDCFKVGDKLLGDCTRTDLLRAARELESESEDMKVRAAFYKQLADLVGKGTVRQASNRGAIVGLLTTTFQA